MRSRRSLVPVLIGALVLASCSSTRDRSVDAALRALPVPTTTAPPSTPPNCDANQPKTYIPSARPVDPLPPPGDMPAGSSMKAIQDHGKLVVGVDQNTLNLGYFDPNDGEFRGFEIALATELARAIFGDGTKVEWRALVSAGRTAAIKNGTVDVVIDGFTITCDRVADLAFSSVYYLAHEQLLVPSDSTVQSLDDLNGKPVCVTNRGTADIFLSRDDPRRAAKPLPDRVADRTDCLVHLQQGTDAAVLADDAILTGFEQQDRSVHVVGPEYTDEPYGIAVSPEHVDLVRFVNGVLDGLRGSGQLAAMASDSGLPSTPPPFTAGCIALHTDDGSESCVPEYSDGS